VAYCRVSQTTCAVRVPQPSKKSAAGRRCGYAFSYDEHCGQVVANSMQVYESTQSLDYLSAPTTTLPRYATSSEVAAVDADNMWHSASEVNISVNDTVPTSRPLEILTE